MEERKLSEQELVRREKLEFLKERGIDPFGQRFDVTHFSKQIKEEYVGKTLSVIVITADREANKLVLSAKDVEKEKAAKEQEKKLNALQKGFVTEGVIERIEPYGCFVTIGDGLSGLVHISQICNKFLHSPNEVVKLGQTVKVKVLDVADGKIRLSMKEAEDIAPEVEEAESIEYHDEEATTSLASLLAGIHFED